MVLGDNFLFITNVVLLLCDIITYKKGDIVSKCKQILTARNIF